MHEVFSMSRRSHRSLRLSALALLAVMAIWPRAKAGVSPPRTAKVTVAQRSAADPLQLSN